MLPINHAELMNQRAFKNAQAQERASKHRAILQAIVAKPVDQRTHHEQSLLDLDQQRRQRKNERAAERAAENHAEAERILQKPASEWSQLERDWLEQYLERKARKSQNDRIRRIRANINADKRVTDYGDSTVTKG
jgi:hypothetical protein